MTSEVVESSIVYVTVSAPFGCGEPFSLPEIRQLAEMGVPVAVFPVRPKGSTCAPDICTLTSSRAHVVGDFVAIVIQLCRSPLRMIRLFCTLLRHSGSVLNFAKNMVVFPRGARLALALSGARDTHLHAYWGSTPATVALIASKLTGCSWSFTVHRGDLRAGNMIEEKVTSAEFCRAISQHSKDWLDRLAGVDSDNGATVMLLGVPHQAVPPVRSDRLVKVFALPANLIPVKGHSYFLHACSLLRMRGYPFKAFCFGDGPLKKSLLRECSDLGLEDVVSFPGALRHDDLMHKYENGEIDVVVLPSIVSRVDEHEGIPVALMEAMSFGIPVIATRTGAISELVLPGAGLLVGEKDAAALSDAMGQLAEDPGLRSRIGDCGYNIVSRHFDLVKNTEKLLGAIRRRPRQPDAVAHDPAPASKARNC